MEDLSDVIADCKKLLKRSRGTSFVGMKANFQLGRLVQTLVEKKGEIAVKELAIALSKDGLAVQEGFLFDAARVFRSLKSEQKLRELQSKLNGWLSWGVLVNSCTKAPSGNTEEAGLYWERVLTQIERTLSRVDTLTVNADTLPADVKEQLKGLLFHIHYDQAREERQILGGNYRAAHMADLQVYEHFTVAGKEEIDPESGKNVRLLGIHRCIRFAVDTMISTNCRACFIPGDATETHAPTPNEQNVLLVELQKLARHMPVFIEPGNHGLSKNPRDANALEFLRGRQNIFVVDKPSIFYQEGMSVNTTPSGQWPQKDCVKIFVLPFPGKSIVESEADNKSVAELNKAVSMKLKSVIDYFRTEIDPRVPNILLAHITVDGALGAESDEMLMYDPHIHPDELREFDYVALGHIHKYQKIDGLNAYYSGSIDRMDFNEEEDKKGFILVEFNGRTPEVQFVETPARKFKTLTPAFFMLENRGEMLERDTIYRIKGEVSKEQYEELKPFLRNAPVPIVNKLTVKRRIRVRDEKMTEDLKEDEAVKRYLEQMEVGKDTINLCLKKHYEIVRG